jgi:hypothetical protein
MRKIFALSLLILLISCKSEQAIVGKYRTNFPSGFFTTEYDFKKNNRFKEIYSGDLQYIEQFGHYTIIDSCVYLKFDEFSKGKELPSYYKLKRYKQAKYHAKLTMENGRLYIHNINTDSIVRKSKIFENDSMVYRERYLKKID